MKEIARSLIQQGAKARSSDVYVLPSGEEYHVFLRKGQERQKMMALSYAEAEKLILYFKYQGQMDVGERRKPQLGAVSFDTGEGQYRLRLSTVSDYLQRESLVIRYLYDQEEKGFHYYLPKQRSQLQAITHQRGLVLFCGPVGSGKTTTMYQLAKSYAKAGKQVITVEDPVEIQEDAFLQIQTNPKIGITYDSLVKLSLRHRPDLLIVGEIRDEETAASVVRGALTGHQIFSTLHVNSKESVIQRMLELGVRRYDLEECLKGAIYQRILPHACQGGEGALFDFLFYGQAEAEQPPQSWQKVLRKVWALGYITEKTYHEES